MRILILATAIGALALPSVASAQSWRGQGHGYGQRDVRQEARECRRELRRADSRREYRRELRECRREITRARYDDRRGYRYRDRDRRYWDGYRWRYRGY